MNSEQRIAEIVRDILDRLQEDRLREEIDMPFQSAAKQFPASTPRDASHKEFHRVLAAFVQDLYLRGLQSPRRLNAQQALAEAIFIVKHYYPGGYEAARLDAASEDPNGFNRILESITEAIKQNERQKYVKLVFATRIDADDWQSRCDIARFLLARWKPFLPREILRCSPAQLADDFHLLIMTYLSTESPLVQLASNSL